MGKDIDAKKDTVTLYHGSNGDVTNIHGDGLFGGVFASGSRESAASHGKNIYVSSLDRSEILTQQEMSYHLPAPKVAKLIKSELRSKPTQAEMADIWEAIVEDKGLYNSNISENRLYSLFRAFDVGEADWAAQKIRGKIAQELGYKAVEMSDEHGTSYLVLPGVKIKKSLTED